MVRLTRGSTQRAQPALKSDCGAYAQMVINRLTPIDVGLNTRSQMAFSASQSTRYPYVHWKFKSHHQPSSFPITAYLFKGQPEVQGSEVPAALNLVADVDCFIALGPDYSIQHWSKGQEIAMSAHSAEPYANKPAATFCCAPWESLRMCWKAQLDRICTVIYDYSLFNHALCSLIYADVWFSNPDRRQGGGEKKI